DPAAASPAGEVRIDTRGLAVRVQSSDTMTFTRGGVTVLVDAPALSIGADGKPHASFGLTVQHPRAALHSHGRLRAAPTTSLRAWGLGGTVSLADGPPLSLRAEARTDRVQAELHHESGGWLHLAAWPDSRTGTVDASAFPLHGLGRLADVTIGALQIDAAAATVDGRLEVDAADDLSVHADGWTLRDVTLEHPKLSSSTVTLGPLRLDGDATVRSAEHLDGAATLSHGGVTVDVTGSRRPGQAGVRLELPTTPCQRLFSALPDGFADTMRGTRVQGMIDGHLEVTVDFDAAQRRAATLAEDPLAEPPAPGVFDVEFPFREQCSVTADPSTVDLEGLRGAYRHHFVDALGTPRSTLLAAGAPHYVPLSRVPLIAGAFVTLEDTRYFRHDGLDPEQIGNALWHNLAKGSADRGASTITQQAARNLFLGLDRSAARKLQEAFLATRLEAVVGKRRLLEVYLNIIELAPGVHGVEDAAQFYFGLSADALTPLQATHLAMLAPAPRTYSKRFVSGDVDAAWTQNLHAQVRRLARHRVISREQMIAALRGSLDLVDRRASP
ncbi:MAG: biosynthetic peptidoglycan transglycosylase, partial [Myxococcota bacterium]